MESIRQWRNEQLEVLRQKGLLSRDDQKRYWENTVSPLFENRLPEQMLFCLLYNDKLVAYGGLVHISWPDKRAEVSFLVDSERAQNEALYREDFKAFMVLIKEIAFEELNFHRLTGETYAFRHYHISLMEQNGFVREGVMRDHIIDNGVYHDALIHGIVNDQPKNQDVKHVLVTSISKKVPLLRALKKAVSKYNSNIKVYGGDATEDCIGRYFVDVFWKMPLISELTAKDLIDYCQTKGINLIIPTRDGELEFFASIKEILFESGISVMVSDAYVVATCLDKLAFAHFNRSAISASENIDDIRGDRYVVKERFGAGALSIGIGLQKRGALDHAKLLDCPIYQPYVSGKEISVDAYFTKSGFIKGMVMRYRNVVVDGESQITKTFSNGSLERKLEATLVELNLRGHIILQAFVDDNENIHVIECNPRFGGASTVSLEAGLDSFYWAYLEAQDISLVDYPFVRVKREITQVRHPQDLYI
jgi:RimJ/RimL family protein N-acetyltransferase/predicted ATP-grasp superfamily ATP-dependent carboligase